MKRKINCHCESVFEVEAPGEINLDLKPEYLKEILKGSFFTFICGNCEKKHKPEFPLIILWPSKNIRLEVFPELERAAVTRKLKPGSKAASDGQETIIGYPEMIDRIAVISDGFEPIVIETIKYYLHLKAEEENQDKEINIWYYGRSGDQDTVEQCSLEFHIHGIRENEVVIVKIPLALYAKNLDEYKKNPKKDIYKALRTGSYLSVKNSMRQSPVSSRRE